MTGRGPPSPVALERVFPALAPVEQVAALAGDGSPRRFYRVSGPGGSWVLMEGEDPLENAAYVRLARHLAGRGVRVPRIRGEDTGRGWVLMEDLGDRSLYAVIRELRASGREASQVTERLYGPVLRLLARFQVLGVRGYRPELGFVQEPYGPRVMVYEEGLYFAREFLGGVLGTEPLPGYPRDLERLAAVGASAPARWLLHRDFQSRNVLLTPGEPAVIDFQSARLGPLAYDAAALILDPYAALPPGVRVRLRRRYEGELSALGVEDGVTSDAWFALGTFRLLQALGAFGKLGGRLRKPGFLEHAATALEHLIDHLGERGRREFPALWATVKRAAGAWAARRRGRLR